MDWKYVLDARPNDGMQRTVLRAAADADAVSRTGAIRS
jgi:hypothetical protein